MPSCHCAEISAYENDVTNITTAIGKLKTCTGDVSDVSSSISGIKTKTIGGFKNSMTSVKPSKMVEPFTKIISKSKSDLDTRLKNVKQQISDWKVDDAAYHKAQAEKAKKAAEAAAKAANANNK